MPAGALQAIVFDFDGVIADSEPLHLRAFQQALADEGIELTPQEYFSRYLGLDDVGVFEALARDRGLAMDDRRVTALVARKGSCLQQMMQEGSVLFPGAREFIRTAAAAVPIGIASGALRHEIDEIIEAAGVADLFAVIVAAGDTPHSKPSPAPYRLAFEKLREAAGNGLEPRRCVAISPEGDSVHHSSCTSRPSRSRRRCRPPCSSPPTSMQTRSGALLTPSIVVTASYSQRTPSTKGSSSRAASGDGAGSATTRRSAPSHGRSSANTVRR